jgi:hypothetical protein
MPVSELSPAYVAPYDPRRRAAERRPPREPPPRPDPFLAPAPAPDPGFLAPVFRPDLSQLAHISEPAPPQPAAEFDDVLGQLVTAVREGDLGRARAALDALETEMLVERSAGEANALRRIGAHERMAAATERLAPVAASTHAADDAYETLAHYLDADGLTF